MIPVVTMHARSCLDIGMPPGMVREDALIAASVRIAVVAGMYSHKRKHQERIVGLRLRASETAGDASARRC